MTCIGFGILFGLSFVLFSCEGQVHLPSNKSEIVVLPGSAARIGWTYVGDPSQATRFWYFTSRNAGSKEEQLAVKFHTNDATISSRKLPNISVEDPATLVLNNVNATYNGKYRFVVVVADGGGESSVEFYVAVTPVITVSCSSVTTVVEGDYFACECEGTDGNPPADVTWYEDKTKIGDTGKEKAILSLSNVGKDENGTYRCEAKSGIEEAKNETLIDLIVYSTPNISINCSNPTTVNEGDYFACECKGTGGNPRANVTWYKDNTQIVTGKEKAILRFTNVDKDDSRTYRCEAKSHEKAKNETSIELIVNCKACRDNMLSGTEWHIIVVSLVSGIIVGILLTYIAQCSHRRWFRKRKPKRNPDEQPTEADSTYQDLDLSKMNQEDNYQSLRGNVARINDVANNDESTYTELSKTRDVEDNYQSLT